MKNILMRGTYEHLSISEKQSMFAGIGEKYHMNLKELTTFSRWGQCTDSAIFEYEGSEFVFVPGDMVTLGWNDFSEGMDECTRNEIMEAFEEFEYDGTVEEFIRTYTSPVRQVKIGPMLVERKLQEFGYERVDIEDPRITGNKEWMESLEKAREYSGLNIVGAVRFTRIEDKWVADLCHHTTYRQLLDSLKEQGFSLPTADEWEYLCGGGCRTLFPWGDSFDFSMHLYHFEDEKNKNMPYDMEEPNFFGLSIAFNPYKSEIVKADKFSTKGGDGGCNICGGMGVVMGYLPCSPYFTSMYERYDGENDMDTEPDNDYSFIRRIIRIDVEDFI